jgi:spore coat protein U-like protein
MSGVRWLVSLFVLAAAMVVGGRCASAQTCSISTTSITFGVYNVFDTLPLTTTGSVNYRCTWWVHKPSVYLSKGSASSNSPRQMANGANRLSYNLYLDAGRTQIWGDPNPYSYSVNGWQWLPDVTLTVYGSIPAGQDVPAGTYSDSVIATLNF